MQILALTATEAVAAIVVASALIGTGMGRRHGVAIGVMSGGTSALIGLYFAAALAL